MSFKSVGLNEKEPVSQLDFNFAPEAPGIIFPLQPLYDAIGRTVGLREETQGVDYFSSS